MAVYHTQIMMGWIEVPIRPIFVSWAGNLLVIRGNNDGASR
jgi:hypothetical protein